MLQYNIKHNDLSGLCMNGDLTVSTWPSNMALHSSPPLKEKSLKNKLYQSQTEFLDGTSS
jgi:hypothetical protein